MWRTDGAGSRAQKAHSQEWLCHTVMGFDDRGSEQKKKPAASVPTGVGIFDRDDSFVCGDYVGAKAPTP